MYVNQENYSIEKKKSLNGAFEISSCIFDKKDCENDIDWYFSYKYGNCYQFNTGFNTTKLKTLRNDDSEFGLKLLIYLMNTNIYPIAKSNGLKVFVHNQSSYPEQSKGVFAKKGEETSIAVSRIFTQNEPQPFSECVDLNGFNSNLYKAILNTNKTCR